MKRLRDISKLPTPIGVPKKRFAKKALPPRRGALSHSITAPSGAATFTATFTPWYPLTVTVSPAASGRVDATPSSADGFYAAGTPVQLAATAAAGFTFKNWTGDLSGATTPQSITMSAPHAVTANFSGNVQPVERLTVGLGPYGSNGGWLATFTGLDTGVSFRNWDQVPWAAYNSTGGGIHVAVGDVDGDGMDEIVIGLSQNVGGWIAILDDAAHNYALMQWIQVQWSDFNAVNGEVFPAVGDLSGDGKAEIIAGLGTGSGGYYEIFGDASTGFKPLAWRQLSWSGYNAANGATHPAAADLDGDGKAEIVLGLGNGGVGWLEIVGSAALNYGHRAWVQVDYQSYNALNGTTYPAAGDLDGDGRADIVVGLGEGSNGWVEVLDDAVAGYAKLQWLQVPWPAYDAANGETHPAVGDMDGDSQAEIVLGLGKMPGSGGWLYILNDAATGYAPWGWIQLYWPAFTQNGGSVFPAIGPLR